MAIFFYLAVIENVQRMQELKKMYQHANQLSRRNFYVAALDSYREFLAYLSKAKKWEIWFIRGDVKKNASIMQIENLQRQLFSDLMERIVQAKYDDIINAELLFFKLESLSNTKFDKKYQQITKKFCDKESTEIISNASKEREKTYKELCDHGEFIKAIKACIEYEMDFKASSFYPEDHIRNAINMILTKWYKPDDLDEFVSNASSILTKMQELIKTAYRQGPNSIREILYQNLDKINLYVTIEKIETIFSELEKPQALFDGNQFMGFLDNLHDLLDLLNNFYQLPNLKTRALSDFYRYQSALSVKLHEFDFHLNPPIESLDFSIIKKEYLKLLQIVEENDDEEEAIKIRHIIESL